MAEQHKNYLCQVVCENDHISVAQHYSDWEKPAEIESGCLETHLKVGESACGICGSRIFTAVHSEITETDPNVALQELLNRMEFEKRYRVFIAARSGPRAPGSTF